MQRGAGCGKSRKRHQMTLEAAPGPLQTIWGHQRAGLHLYGVEVVKMPPCRVDDLRRHALDGGYKAAAKAHLPRPQGVLTMISGCGSAPSGSQSWVRPEPLRLRVWVEHRAADPTALRADCLEQLRSDWPPRRSCHRR